MSLGENIARLRAQKGWSQGQLAEELEVSRQSVSKWETDASVPDLDKLVKLGEVFSVTLDELVRGGQNGGHGAVPPARTSSPGQGLVAPAPPPPVPSSPPAAGHTGVSGAQKTAALVLFLLGLFTTFFFLLLEGSALGVISALPFWLCAAICALCRKNAGLWCGWAMYFCAALFLRLATGISWSLVLLTPRYEGAWNYTRLAMAWCELAVILLLLAVTVLRFRRRPLATGRKTLAALAAGWLGFLLARAVGVFLFDSLFRLTGVVRLLGFLYCLFGFLQLAALAVLLCFSARFLHSRRCK